MKFRKIIFGTALILSASSVSAESVKPYYFDLISLHEKSSIASNYINNSIRELGGIERVKEAADAGHDKASMIMGYLYLEGHVYEQNTGMALDILRNASHHGGFSAFLLGKHLLDLTGVNDYPESVRKEGAELIESAAMRDIAEAEYIAGMLYINGEYLPEDRDVGMMHIKSASYKGHAPSRKFLTDIDSLYYQSKLDFDKIQKMATEGSVDAIIELSLMYKEGWKVQRDNDKALRLMQIAEAKGSDKATQFIRIMED